VLSRRFGYDQGFTIFDDDFSGSNSPEGTTLWEGEAIEGHFYGTADDTTDRALAWLRDREHPERPAFLFIHYFDPHFPYVPPVDFVPKFKATPKEALRIGRMIFVYDVLISFMDQEIGRFLDEIERPGLSRDPIMIVTADHGEGLMAHGHMYHGAQIYEEAVRVPLIVRWPGRVPAGRVLNSPIATVELGPTILALIGETDDGAIGAGGFAPMLLGEPEVEPERAAPIFLFRRHYDGVEEVSEGVTPIGEMYGVRQGRWKLIEGPDEGTLELFDLERDPTEQINRVAEEPERTASLRQLIADWRLRYEQQREITPLSEEDRQRLRALGYVE
jgi:arylsulfatase A-like enzyme